MCFKLKIRANDLKKKKKKKKKKYEAAGNRTHAKKDTRFSGEHLNHSAIWELAHWLVSEWVLWVSEGGSERASEQASEKLKGGLKGKECGW